MGTESGRQRGYIVGIPHVAHGGPERHILGKDKDLGPSLQKLEEAGVHRTFRLKNNCCVLFM